MELICKSTTCHGLPGPSFILGDTDWHQRAVATVVALRKKKTSLADDLVEDITVLLARTHRVQTSRECHERIIRRLERLCDEAQALLLPKIVVGVTGANGGIGKETMLQAAQSALVKRVIGLVRISGRGPAAGNVMDLTDRWQLDRLGICKATIEIRTYKDLENTPTDHEPVDVFIHTVGQGRKPVPLNPDTLKPIAPPPTRQELLANNQSVLKDVVGHTHRACPDALHIFVTNPIGHRLMQVVLEKGVAPEKILGFGGELDSARFRHFIWQALEADGHCILDVRAQVIGEHNDNMIPLQGSEVTFASGVTLSLGRCVAEGILSAQSVQKIIDRTIRRGLEIVDSQGTSAVRGPARGLIVMLERLLRGEVANGLSCRPFHNGKVSFIGGPVRLKNGLAVVPEPVESHISLTPSEKVCWLESMQASCIKSCPPHA